MVNHKIVDIIIANHWSGKIVLDDIADRLSEYENIRIPDSQQWVAFLEKLIHDPASLRGYVVLKYSQAGEVFQARCETSNGSINVICKQSRPVGIIKKLSQIGRTRREKKNFNRALDLNRAGISTARPLAYIECQKQKRRAWLITEYLPDLIDLDQWLSSLSSLQDRSESYRLKKRITQLIATLFVNLQQNGWHHRDLKASNLLLQKHPTTNEPLDIFLVDLDGLNKPRIWSSKKRYQPLVRLAASLQQHPAVTSTDYVRFLKTYLQHSSTFRLSFKSLFRSLTARVNSYVRRSVGRKTHKLDGYTADMVDPST